MIHIVFIVPYYDMHRDVEEAFQLISSEEEIVHETIVVKPKEEMQLQLDCDVVISRGFTSLYMRSKDILNVELKTTGYDILMAVKRCRETYRCRKMALIGTANMIYGIQNIRDIFEEAEVIHYLTDDRRLLQSNIERACEEGAEAIIGGRASCDIAQSLGIPYTLIRTGREAICEAVEEAVRFVAATRKEREKRDRLKKIMDYSFEGIISTEKNGVITSINKGACSMFHIKEESAVGSHIAALIPEIDIDRVVIYGENMLNELKRVRSRTITLNCVPISGENENSGMVVTCQDVTDLQELEAKIRKKISGNGFVAKYRFENIIYRDKGMEEVIRIAQKFSRDQSNVLIYGETGTGKELFAQSIHNVSSRKNYAFVAINCAALPEQLLESELFGYVEGAFTGAAKGGKMGLFEVAHNGTIFLDEIGDLSAKLQGRLLRVLQEKEIMRLGHDKVIPVNVRVIAATNKNLRKEVEEGKFRSDLLYRLDVLQLKLPPLRERKEDIIPLLKYYIERAELDSVRTLKRFSQDAEKLLISYPWYGNVRELRNFVHRICVLCETETAEEESVRKLLEFAEPEKGTGNGMNGRKMVALDVRKLDMEWSKAEIERMEIQEALEKAGGNRGEAARILRMDRSTLWRKMKRYQIEIKES
ncbi:sigma 54-interacting transcriptional regulator [Clostridium sp. AM58-1XD]|uniref:sigma 54-interacting transcriptional regulator n=1 Tax=Clostridium sp. AM58-1XD TaxID=2292307 RepID=UPI000E50F4A7|nr:sigma 54-interacting transcriptional regulator [Clostridium sp. AM58-1XD]RGY97829.1 PAS domain S-box protein [Clostridium sp. AM58-1XD]